MEGDHRHDDEDDPLWSTRQRYRFLRVRNALMKAGHTLEEASEQASRVINSRPDPRSGRRVAEGESTKDDLYREAMRFNITGRSKMDKEQLEEAVRRRRQLSGDDRSN